MTSTSDVFTAGEFYQLRVKPANPCRDGASDVSVSEHPLCRIIPISSD
jgi:hypothetical protein